MGKINNAINHYLSDNRRFADLFNGIYFHGETVIRTEDGFSYRDRDIISDIAIS